MCGRQRVRQRPPRPRFLLIPATRSISVTRGITLRRLPVTVNASVWKQHRSLARGSPKSFGSFWEESPEELIWVAGCRSFGPCSMEMPLPCSLSASGTAQASFPEVPLLHPRLPRQLFASSWSSPAGAQLTCVFFLLPSATSQRKFPDFRRSWDYIMLSQTISDLFPLFGSLGPCCITQSEKQQHRLSFWGVGAFSWESSF